MKKKPIKKYRAKLFPLYSIQFTLNKKGEMLFHETSNIPDDTEPFAKEESLSFTKWGVCLANSHLLTQGDKERLARLFKAYLDYYKYKG